MPDSPRQTHRSFTVRVPMSRYIKITDLADESNSNINTKVNELIELGLGENIKIEEILVRLLRRHIADEGTTDAEG